MVGFPATLRPTDNAFRVNRLPYPLATQEQAKQLGARRAFDVVLGSAQDRPLADPFALHMDYRAGYGFTFAAGVAGYEKADGWDASALGRLTTWPRHATLEAVADQDFRGWWYYDFASGYLYLLRGRYVCKYAPDDSGAEWSILEYHVLGVSGEVVCGQPAQFGGRLYVPISTAATGVLSRFHELTTVATPVTEVQTIVISGSPNAGTYTITFNDGLNSYTTSALAYNASGADVQTALRALPGLQKVTVATAGTTPNFTHTVTMTAAPSALTAASPPQFTSTRDAAFIAAGGSIAHATTVAGTGDTWNRGDANVESSYFSVWNKPAVGPVLVRSKDNQVSMAATAPVTAGNWSAAQDIYDSSFDVTAHAPFGRLLYIGKPNMLASLDESGIVVNEIPSISSVLDTQNFVGMKEHNGWLYCPHKLGLIRYRPGAPWSIVGAEEDDALEGDRSTGWGSVVGLAPYGKYAYVTVNDYYNTIGAVASLQQTRRQDRGQLTPHMHHQLTPVEDLAVCSLRSRPAQPLALATWSDDNAVGTLTWANPTNPSADDAAYAATDGTAGQSHYLKGLDLNLSIPTTATILGLTVTLYRSKAVLATATAATGAGTGANFASIGTNAWTNPGNITASDNSYATNATAGTTQGLRASNFGFAIPTAAEVLGLTVEIERKASTAAEAGGVVTLVASASASADASTSVTVDKPTGTAEGDVMVAVLTNNQASAATLSGWTNVTTGGAGYPHVQLLWKVATGAEGASYTFTGGASAARNGAILTLRGADPTNPIDAHAATLPGDHLFSVPTSSITTTVANTFLIAAFGANTSGYGTNPTWTPPSGMTEQVDRVANSILGFEIATASQAAAGATGAKTAVSSVEANTAAQLVAIRPGGVLDSRVSIVKADASAGSTNKSATAVWPTTEAYASFGGAADLWGETWTPADINDSDFGAVFSATVLGAATASVDHVRITVAYQIADVVDTVVRLVKAGTVTGDNKAATTTQWPTSEAAATYGSSTDLWGTTWTAAEVMAADFGIVVSATVTSGGYARVQYATVEVAYSVPGAANPASYLAVIQVSTDGATASPVAYRLPAAGLSVANDPQIPKYVSAGATFTGARIYGPTRATTKRYASLELYLELAAATAGALTPGVRFEAQVDDSGTWTPLEDESGASTFHATGQLELFFPQAVASGRWVQIRHVIDATAGAEVGVSVTLRDVTLRGFLESEVRDETQAVLVLSPHALQEDGHRSPRTAQQMVAELLALAEPPRDSEEPQVVIVHDPVLHREIPVEVMGLAISEFDFPGTTESTFVAVLKYARLRARRRAS